MLFSAIDSRNLHAPRLAACYQGSITPIYRKKENNRTLKDAEC
jgi:hypothetical protein